MSAGQKGKQFSVEHRAKLSEKLRGRPVSEAVMRVFLSNKGRKHSAETIEKNRRAHIGIKLSEAAKAKVSAAVRARPPISEETRQRISNAAKNRISPEQSKETLEKRSKSMAEYWSKVRSGEIVRAKKCAKTLAESGMVQ